MRARFIFFSSILALSLGLGSVPAAAQTSPFYFAGYLGLSTFGDQDFSESSVPASGDIELKNGTSFAAAIGLRLSNQFRLESEFLYNKTDMDRIENGAGSFELGGELTTWGGLLNLYYDFDVPWAIQPFIGAGIGYGWHEGELSDGTGPNLDISGDDSSGLIWQVGGGVQYQISPEFAFTGAYRYLDTVDLEFSSYEIDYGAHEFRVGFQYDFSSGE